MDLAVLLDEVVVANTLVVKASVVTGTKHIEREALVGARCATVNYY